jgi:hypothetical protein
MADNKILIVSPHDITERMAGPESGIGNSPALPDCQCPTAAPNDHDLPQSKSLKSLHIIARNYPLVESCDVVLIKAIC